MSSLFTLPGIVGRYADIAGLEECRDGVPAGKRQFTVLMRDGRKLSTPAYAPDEFDRVWQEFCAAWEPSVATPSNEASALRLEVKKLRPEAKLPVRSSDSASCFDVCAVDAGTIAPGQRALVKTGLQMAVPRGYEVQVRSRSGHAAKAGVFVLNSPGTVDSDYRGEVGVILQNNGTAPFVFAAGDRIAQIAVCAVEMCPAVEVETLSDTRRGSGGFGSTGVK